MPSNVLAFADPSETADVAPTDGAGVLAPVRDIETRPDQLTVWARHPLDDAAASAVLDWGDWGDPDPTGRSDAPRRRSPARRQTAAEAPA